MNNHSQVIEQYQRDGVVRISQLFSAEMITKIREELQRYICEDLDAKPADARTLEADGKTIRNLWRLEQHCPYFRQLAQQAELVELIGQLVGGEPVLCGVETFSKPARIGSGVPYHQDNAYFCQTPPDMLTLWIAIDRVTVENGAVTFILGSHQQGMLPTKPSGVTGNSIGLANEPTTPKSEQFCATLEPGDATIHHCQIIHHSDANQTDQSRLGLLFVYRASHTKTDSQLKHDYTTAVTTTPPA
ncbi:MAG: phytanoyl-CoA dioxygenase family protein [Planctomycetaceae bacterium]|nr:phytanoyl-CoA dioxygenase family protein [Planctomycetaceae bacterium]